MYRFALTMTPAQVEAVAAQLYVEMLEAGFCRVGEFHYLHHDRDGRPYATLGEMAERIAAAAAETGIGLTLLPVFYAHATFGGAPATPDQRRFINDLDRYARLLEASRAAVAGLPDALVGVAPHSLRAVTPDELAGVVELAGASPIHIHVAEQVKEVEDCLAWSGARPVEWLLDHAPVDERWCLIHATHMTPEETAAMARTRRGRGALPDHRGQSRRRHLRRSPLHGGRRPVRHRLGFQRPDRRRRRVAPARIFAAPRLALPQRDGILRRVHRPNAVRRGRDRAGPPRSAARSPPFRAVRPQA